MYKNSALFAIIACLQWAAQAQTATPDLSRCLADHTSGKERKELAQWVFLAMAAHPDIRRYESSDGIGATDAANRTTANLFTRLLAEDCAAETRAAVKDGGTATLQSAFQTLGQLAMQELMSDEKVKANMGAFERYLDQKKLFEALAPK